MPTYQEQIEKNRESSTFKAMVTLAELADVDKAMRLLVRDGVIDNEARMAFCAAFLRKHPEVNAALKRHDAAGGEPK